LTTPRSNFGVVGWRVASDVVAGKCGSVLSVFLSMLDQSKVSCNGCMVLGIRMSRDTALSNETTYSQHFAGKNILVVEDEYFLADETRRKLETLGAIVVGPTGNVRQALHLIEDSVVHCAILDIHLDGELVFPVAEKLEMSNIPFVFATGYDPSIVPARFSGFVLCEKPTELEYIAQALFGPPPAST
jgi:CheY-like chemotaxis protein